MKNTNKGEKRHIKYSSIKFYLFINMNGMIDHQYISLKKVVGEEHQQRQRIIYRVFEDEIQIVKCRVHYD